MVKENGKQKELNQESEYVLNVLMCYSNAKATSE